MSIILKETERGFRRGEFTDRYGNKCSIQESSLATEPAIWIGRNKARAHITMQQAKDLLPLLQHFAEKGYLR